MKAKCPEPTEMVPLSLIADDSSAPFAAALERFNGTPSAFLGGDVTIDGCGEMSQYSIASEDRLLTTAQCGDQQAFIELCRRHAAAVKKRMFSIVRNKKIRKTRFRMLCSRAYVFKTEMVSGQ
jgi:hypothetical protein